MWQYFSKTFRSSFSDPSDALYCFLFCFCFVFRFDKKHTHLISFSYTPALRFSLSLTHTHTQTHTYTHTNTHTHTKTLFLTHTPIPAHSHSPFLSIALSHALTYKQSHSASLSPSLSHTQTHKYTLPLTHNYTRTRKPLLSFCFISPFSPSILNLSFLGFEFLLCSFSFHPITVLYSFRIILKAWSNLGLTYKLKLFLCIKKFRGQFCQATDPYYNAPKSCYFVSVLNVVMLNILICI